RSNVKILTIASIAMSVMFGIMQCFILYGAYQEAAAHAEKASVDIGKISCILMGLLFIILGNFMPKTRTNSIIGVRISWSMYNDTTWQKSNRFGGIALILTGILTILTAAILPNSLLSTVLSLLYLTAATTVILIYAHGIYKKEKA
ncbi:MAG: SdpI family protein, partial [Lachnospiraceae bacterium]|nr:SdpI family protein [Lachnospiraceae bacterium]